MRKKAKKLELIDPISKKVMQHLILRNGDDALYDLCNYIGFDPASFRRKLEKEKGWKEIEHINGILDYFDLSYEIVFRNGKYDWSKQIDELKKEIKKRDDQIQHLKEALATILGVDKNLMSNQAKKSSYEQTESVNKILDSIKS